MKGRPELGLIQWGHLVCRGVFKEVKRMLDPETNSAFEKVWRWQVHLSGIRSGGTTAAFTAVPLTAGERRKQPKCLLRHEWINRVCSFYAMNVVQPLKRGKFRHVLQHGCILRTICSVTSARHKRTNAV